MILLTWWGCYLHCQCPSLCCREPLRWVGVVGEVSHPLTHRYCHQTPHGTDDRRGQSHHWTWQDATAATVAMSCQRPRQERRNINLTVVKHSVLDKRRTVFCDYHRTNPLQGSTNVACPMLVVSEFRPHSYISLDDQPLGLHCIAINTLWPLAPPHPPPPLQISVRFHHHTDIFTLSRDWSLSENDTSGSISLIRSSWNVLPPGGEVFTATPGRSRARFSSNVPPAKFLLNMRKRRFIFIFWGWFP